MAKREETVAEREWHDFKAELLGRPHESLDLFDIERSIQHRLSAMGRELMAAAMKRADSDAPEVTSRSTVQHGGLEGLAIPSRDSGAIS